MFFAGVTIFYFITHIQLFITSAKTLQMMMNLKSTELVDLIPIIRNKYSIFCMAMIDAYLKNDNIL